MTMRALLERVAATITSHRMLAPGQRVLVAYSGGADSTVLLHVLLRLGYEVMACHVHHGLRGAEADADAAQAAAFAASLGVPYHERRVDAAAYAATHKLSIEAGAREVRYAALEEVAQELGADRIATGHTADDQAETVLLNLLRGAGPAGLSGMPPVRGKIIRPLLAITGAEAEAYARAEGISFRRDSSNADRRFTRNRVRHDLFPALAEIQPDVIGALGRVASIMREENAFLSSLVDQLLATIVVRDDRAARIALHDLQSVPAALQRRLLREVVAVIQGRTSDIEFERIEALVDLAARGQTGAVIELPGGLRAERTYEEIVISVGAPETPARPAGEWTLPVPGTLALPEFGVTLRTEESSDVGLSPDASVVVLDAADLAGTLTVRTWRDGDRFVPLGMTQAVKLQDFFVNAKVPRARRRRTLLVESAGEIVWVVGLRISERHKVTPETRRTIRLRVERL